MYFIRNIKPYLKLALSFVFIYLLVGIGLYLLEQDINPRCRNLFDAFWSTTVFFFSGFGDFGPVPRGVKTISLFMFVLVQGILVIVSAYVVSTFASHELREVRTPSSTT